MNLLKNVKWASVSQIFKVIVQIANLVILTRFIKPDDYGLMAISMVFINFGLLLKDQGLSKAIIQKLELKAEVVNAIFWCGIYTSILVYLIIFLSADFIAGFYESEELTHILRMIALIFPIGAFSSVHVALLERESKFKIIAFVELTCSIVSFIVAIILAYLGYGVYALVFQAISYSVMNTFLLIFSKRFSISISGSLKLAPIKEVLSFSVNLFLFNIINFFSRNLDNILIGRFLGVISLGTYNLAYRIMQFPLQSITFVFSRALLPVASKAQNDNKNIERMYLNSVFSIAFLVFPLMIFLTNFGVETVTVFIGEEWKVTGEILEWLAICSCFQCINSLSGSIFMAKDKTKFLLRLGSAGACIHITGFIIGVNFDIVSFSKIYVVTTVINSILVIYFTTLIIDSSIFKVFSRVKGILAYSLVSLIIVVNLSRFLDEYAIFQNGIVNILLNSFIYACLYLSMIAVLSSHAKLAINNLIHRNSNS
ncbi:lipopolysaccharide biosynthesis protein [Alteromonas sp. BZK5]|uniref:lipopolysaccharide biosynthesis protein n=1 Tax=Alteromonas sp. BZK5 TaxID=1904459 RepID=UPI0016537476|nr:lipopolysaccharide biosynthesis protein [Alteromonas sp. BZK5]MBC6985299.1 lipopolysaccharide biosynthesis protein [Alteromonas sp. BZK5]